MGNARITNAVIGKSDSGKSFTVKILLHRLHQKFPDSHIYVIDPMGEYGTISQFFGMQHLNITKNDEQLGLDPFILLEPQDAADTLAEMTNHLTPPRYGSRNIVTKSIT
ncbi:MAG: helicase HerA domain-containing protein [Nitrosopumilus sp.]